VIPPVVIDTYPDQEMNTEIAPLKEQFHTALAAAPGSWVKRIQQSQSPLTQSLKNIFSLTPFCRILPY